jgi:hypothetical protein
MKNLTAHQVVIVSSLMAGALQAATIQSMVRKGIITNEEGHEIYEQALLMLETSQVASSSPDMFEAARELIEQHLRESAGSLRPGKRGATQAASTSQIARG